MATLQIGDSSPVVKIFPAFQHVVEVKATWGGTWTRVPYLRCNNAVECTGPAIGTARFTYEYGNIKREDTSTFSKYSDLNLSNYFIRVCQISGGSSVPWWTGIVIAPTLMPGGKGVGQQIFEAVGLCNLLDRDSISTAKVSDDYGGIKTIQWVPSINERYQAGVAVAGNRASIIDADGAFVFGKENNQWNNLQAAEMILNRYTPANGPKFKLGGQKLILNKLQGVHVLTGRTPWAVINELISRNRGLVFAPEVNGDTVTLMIDTILEEPVSVGAFTLSANSKKQVVDFDSFIEIDQPRVTYSAATKFDKIEIRGARILACATFAWNDESIEEGWTDVDEQEYKDGSKVNYAALDAKHGHSAGDGEKAAENDRFRQNVKFEQVYCKHRVPRNWNGQVGDGVGGAKVPIVPHCNDDGTVRVNGLAPFWNFAKAFEPWLPFEEGKDYTVNPPVASGQRSGAEPSFIRPFAIIQDFNSIFEAEKCYDMIDRPWIAYEHAAAHLTILPREMAILVEANPRHLYGRRKFLPDVGGNAEPTNVYPIYDYRTLMATLAFRTDTVLKMVVSRDGLKDSELVRTLVISIPDAEYWYCAPGTVLGTLPISGLKRLANGVTVLRDDSPRLKEITALAKAWYCQDRSGLTVPIKRIDKFVPLGALIVGSLTAGTLRKVGTVVTSTGWDFDNNSALVQTSWSELDLSGGW